MLLFNLELFFANTFPTVCDSEYLDFFAIVEHNCIFFLYCYLLLFTIVFEIVIALIVLSITKKQREKLEEQHIRLMVLIMVKPAVIAIIIRFVIITFTREIIFGDAQFLQQFFLIWLFFVRPY